MLQTFEALREALEFVSLAGGIYFVYFKKE